MVKAKQNKSKTKKQPHIKKQGKQADISQFRAQLDALGLKIVQVTADGNCFFRALADQLEGNEEEHGKYRSMVVQYIVKNRETFEPFIEDDVPFDEYCQSMDKDGTWAGHMELQAASLVTHSNICIHRNMSPRWYIQNFDYYEAPMIHLSYHDEEHYNSVRLKADTCTGPARPIIIKADADLSTASHQAKSAASKSKGGAGTDSINAGSIKLVMAGSGCENAEKVERVVHSVQKVLLQVAGDVDAAIEFLVAEQGMEEHTLENDLFSCHTETSQEIPLGGSPDDIENVNCEQHKEEEPFKVISNSKQDLSSISIKPTQDDSRSNQDEKVPRNKVCPCGSKKKYKACCGSAKGRSSNNNHTVDSRKSRKERKQSKKGGPTKSTSSCGSDGGPPDMDHM